MIWNEFLNIIDCDGVKLFLSKEYKGQEEISNPILLVSHDLTRTGAPIALLNMAKSLQREKYTVFILCHFEGILSEDIRNAGIHLIIYSEYYSDQKWLVKVSNVFKTIIVNSIMLIPYVLRIGPISDRIFWWIHESEFLFRNIRRWWESETKNQKESLPQTIPLASSVHMLAVSNLVKGNIRKYFGTEAEILPYFVEDSGLPIKDRGIDFSDKVSFVQVGTLDFNKGQSLIVDAISMLPEEVYKKSRFTFVGDKTGASVNVNVLKKVCECAELLFNVRLLPLMPQPDLYCLFDEADVVIISSYAESLPTTAVEAFMKGKLCICADSAGITDYVVDGKNIILFQAGDAESLCEKITYVVENINHLESIRLEGRKVFEQHFSESIFQKRLVKILTDEK